MVEAGDGRHAGSSSIQALDGSTGTSGLRSYGLRPFNTRSILLRGLSSFKSFLKTSRYARNTGSMAFAKATAGLENAVCHTEDSMPVGAAAQYRERLRIQELLRYVLFTQILFSAQTASDTLNPMMAPAPKKTNQSSRLTRH